MLAWPQSEACLCSKEKPLLGSTSGEPVFTGECSRHGLGSDTQDRGCV